MIYAAVLALALLGRTTSHDIEAGRFDSQCTAYITEYVHARYGVWPDFEGDARIWATTAAENGWRVGAAPAVGAVLIMEPGGVNHVGELGHVAIVRQLAAGRALVSDRNWTAPGVDATHWVQLEASDRFIYLPAAPGDTAASR